MLQRVTKIILVATVAFSTPAFASSSDAFRSTGASRSAAELPAYLQCVPYARQLSGIQIYGDAHTWWKQAAGRYQRGNQPKVGAVLAFRPHRNMQLGHVATVSKLVDSRTVLLRHANWSPINGRRGQIERDVRAIDVSPNNDWSQVRVWYAPIRALGKTAWPTHGFIYSGKKPNLGAAPVRVARAAEPKPVRARSSAAFLSAFANMDKPTKPVARNAAPTRRVAVRRAAARPVKATAANRDPFASVIARYEN